MKNLKLENYGVLDLNTEEMSELNGGADDTPTTTTGFWNGLAYIYGATVKGCIVFGTEGGRNAGICVK